MHGHAFYCFFNIGMYLVIFIMCCRNKRQQNVTYFGWDILGLDIEYRYRYFILHVGTYFSKLLRSFFKHRQFMSGWRTIFRYVKDIWVKLCRTIAYLHKIYTNVFTIQFQFIRIRSGRSILIFLKLEKNQIGLLYIFHCISFIFIFLTSLIIEQRKKT